MRGFASAARAMAKQLALPLAQAAAALTQEGVVALGQPLDERIGVRQPGRSEHFLIARLRPAKADVFHHGALNKKVSCSTIPICCAGFPGLTWRTSSHRSAPPFGDIIKTRDQVDDGGFAGPGRSDDGDGLPRFGGKADIAQHRLVGFVAGGDTLNSTLPEISAWFGAWGSSWMVGCTSSKPKMRSPPAMALWMLVHSTEICWIGLVEALDIPDEGDHQSERYRRAKRLVWPSRA
jgi:hypothetical protein